MNTLLNAARPMRLFTVLAFAGTAATLANAADTFELPLGSEVVRGVHGMSDNGEFIVGYAINNTSWVWDPINGRRDIPNLEGYTQGRVGGLSGDGRYLSFQHVRTTSPSRQAGRFDLQTWTHETSGFYNGNRPVDAFGISPDGHTIPATLVRGTAPATEIGVYRPATGLTSLHTFPVDTSSAFVYVATNDAGLIAGQTSGQIGNRGFRWSSSLGFQFVPQGPTALSSAVLGGSDDADVLIGYVGTTPIESAAMWTGPSMSLTILDAVPNAARTRALATNGDGTVVGGSGWTNPDVSPNIAWLWSNLTGTVSLQAYLQQQGLEVPGLRSVNAISDDRRVISGMTNDGLAYRVVLEQPFGVIPSTPSALIMVVGTTILNRRRRSVR